MNINIKDATNKSYEFKADNITFNGANPSIHQQIIMNITGNFCTIKDLSLESLHIYGSNNSISNVICNHVNIVGEGNQLSNVRTLHIYEGKFGIALFGKNNVLQSFKCCPIPLKSTEDRVFCTYSTHDNNVAFLQSYIHICIYVTDFSESCTLENGIVRNALIKGRGHVLKNIKCINSIEINRKDHRTIDVDAVKFIDLSTNPFRH